MKRKLLTVLLALVAALCLCLGLTACGGDDNKNKENDGHEHIYTVENKCSVCGKEWEYTKSDALDYTKVVLDGVEGYDVRFGEYHNFYYDETDRTVKETVIGKPFEGAEVVFPYGYNGLPVISIGRFYPCMSDTVKHITVPKSIISFGQGIIAYNGTRGAFRCSALEKLDLPDGLPVLTRQDISADYEAAANTAFPLCIDTLFSGIGGMTLDTCPLYDDPQYRENGALYIGNYLFGIDLEEPVETFTVRDGTKAIIMCRGAKHVIVPDSVEVIGDSAFSHSELESIEVGNGIEEIGNGAFYESNLTSITLPDKPIYIGQGAFMDTPFLMNQANWEYPDGQSAENYTSSSLYIGNHLISCVGRDTSSRSFEIKPNLKSIAGGAFEDCTIGELHIPSIEAWLNIRRGGRGATPRTEKLIVGGQETTEITIPSSVTEIPDYAFSSINSLTKVTLHDGVTKIGDGAFLACENLSNVNIPNGVTAIGNFAFCFCPMNADIDIPDTVRFIGYDAFQGCRIASPVIPAGVKAIQNGTFMSCQALESIVIPASVKAIGSQAFGQCSALTDIQFKGTVEEWKAIEKGTYWDYNIDDYTVTCTNGKIAKDGTVTMN